MAERDLTPKQEAFCREYLIDLNATQAAIRAGYSAKGATVRGAQLLANRKVSEFIAAASAARAKRTEIDADWVLRRLADEATADLADIIDEAGAIKPVSDWPLIWRQGLVAGIDVHEDMVEGVKAGQTVKIKLSDRIKRIELIGKHVNVQAFREQVHNTGAINLTVSQDDAEL
ncbi:MAG: terminase [Pseudomonas sp.]|nr:terminase [Pseudomonas sp.]QDP67260.1 MAG: putative terminase small subunit [Prokaryotic dsDNA virus sp.]|tara:strand:+ start:10176 stop:10694 length:519 start_codon:yes stop_codon:yes gene_type:complete